MAGIDSVGSRTIIVAILLVAATWSNVTAAEVKRDLSVFFSGHLIAKGQFKNFIDGTKRGTTIDIRGGQTGKTFTLTENTTYSDGEKQRKVWKFTKLAEGRYIGRRSDLIGDATVEAKGQRIELNYAARVPSKDGTVRTLKFKETFSFTSARTGTYVVRVWLSLLPVGEARLSVQKQVR